MQRVIVLLAVAGVLAACTAPNVATQGFTQLENARVLMLPPDIKYYRITASGITEPHAEWTNRARESFSAAFDQFAAASGIEYEVSSRDQMDDDLVAYDRLHSAVGATIISSHYGPAKLQSKKIAGSSDFRFDWSLGPGVAALADNNNARYALFVYFRDYQASGGRVGLAMFAALFGAAVYTGHQGGFASLVDLQSGDVVWFNNLSIAQGDMRSPAGAAQLVEQIFAEFAADNA